MLDLYDFSLPEELLATQPASPRESARLFVYDPESDRVAFDTFANLARYLPSGALLLLNETKVVPARARLTKPTGGAAEVLFLVNETRADSLVRGMADRRLTIGDTLTFSDGTPIKVVGQEEKYLLFDPERSREAFLSLLERTGTTPLPPYILKKGTTLSEKELRVEYQSVFAKEAGSVAAPTASIHLSEPLLAALANHGVHRAPVSLHVGLGTFAPVSEDQIAARDLFAEAYMIPEETEASITQTRAAGKPIIPVGTTACRAIESGARRTPAIATDGWEETRILLAPGDPFLVAGGIITNFHLPRSSLLLLVDALLAHLHAPRRIMDLYAIAIQERFRFYSFGDGMCILPGALPRGDTSNV